jgi:DNA-binding transcriptional LysR family regulator
LRTDSTSPCGLATRRPARSSPASWLRIYIAMHGRPQHPADVAGHACIAFYDAANGQAFDWEFRKGRRVLPVNIASRLLVSDVGAMLNACEAGSGIAQIMQLGAGDLIQRGKLVELFPDWSGELFPLYALYPSRQHRAAKVRAFVDFCLTVLARANRHGTGIPSRT